MAILGRYELLIVLAALAVLAVAGGIARFVRLIRLRENRLVEQLWEDLRFAEPLKSGHRLLLTLRMDSKEFALLDKLLQDDSLPRLHVCLLAPPWLAQAKQAIWPNHAVQSGEQCESCRKIGSTGPRIFVVQGGVIRERSREPFMYLKEWSRRTAP
ncbi:hypothetical protein J19TS2_44140 [Cohnella xylanilytica]|nr:hypothetical protein J19TS2_44140 [Cohnella xylanilytica]